MSSAILYLAIVAIWACVLIPRWLRRDSARGVSAPAPAPVVAGPADAVYDGSLATGSLADVDEVVAPPARFVQPLSAEESHRRMLAARRRLLLMLIGLEISAIPLAFLGLAAVWVVVPPSIMLFGYLLLLREAGRADVEWAQRQAAAAAARQARERARARRITPVEGIPTAGVAEAVAALTAKFAAAPVPADYEEYGRDFAPGLAGKYTTSNADARRAEPAEPAESADEDYYEAYDPPRLRAVGD